MACEATYACHFDLNGEERSTQGTFRQIDCVSVSIDGSKYGNCMCEACVSIVFESNF